MKSYLWGNIGGSFWMRERKELGWYDSERVKTKVLEMGAGNDWSDLRSVEVPKTVMGY
jgi:hypothetical protein